MATKKYYSLQQLAKATGIPDSTVRYYAKTYSEYLPSSRLKGKKYPVYDHEAIEVLKTIREAQNDNIEKPEIEIILMDKFSFIDQTPQGNKPAKQQLSNKQKTAINPQLPAMQIASQFTNFIENQTKLTEHFRGQSNIQSEVIEQLKEENKKLQLENLKLKQEVEELERKITKPKWLPF